MPSQCSVHIQCSSTMSKLLIYTHLFLLHPLPNSLRSLCPLAMQTTPHAPNTLIQTLHIPPTLDLPILLSTRIPQQHRLLEHLIDGQIPHANSLARRVYVMCADHRVRVRAWRDVNLDAGGRGREGGEARGEEGAILVEYKKRGRRGEEEERARTSCLWTSRPSRSSGSRAACIAG